MRYYPYFQITPQEQKDAKSGANGWDKVWSNFKKYIIMQIKDSKIKEAARVVMEKRMGVEAFAESGGSYNDIIGILGELQGMIMLEYLSNGRSTSRFLGHVLDDKGKKVGIDLALEGIGF
jgi:hypothetical protein